MTCFLPPHHPRGFVAGVVLIVLVIMVLGYCDVQRTIGGVTRSTHVRAVP